MELITDLINSVKMTLDSINETIQDHLVNKLDNCKSRQQARDLVNHLDKNTLLKIAKKLNLNYTKPRNKSALINHIIQHVIGYRIDSMTIQNYGID